MPLNSTLAFAASLTSEATSKRVDNCGLTNIVWTDEHVKTGYKSKGGFA